MKVTQADVKHVARLARLGLSEAEIETFQKQLSDILSYFDKLQELDTEGVPPTAHPTPLKNVFREDVARPAMPREKVLANAPEEQDGYFRVPRILEEE